MLPDARTVLKRLANGEDVPAVYGLDRPAMRDALVATLRGMRPSEDDRIAVGWGYGNPRRVRAYDLGVQYLADAYNTVLTD